MNNQNNQTMDNTKSIFGATPSQIVKSFNDEFKVIYEDGARLQAVSKVFHHDDEDLEFDYQYVLSVIDSEEYTSDKPRKLIYTLDLVPTFKSLCKAKQDSVKSCIGCDDDSEPNAVDILDYGLCVSFGVEEHNIDTDEDINNDTDKYLDVVANVFEAMDSLRGFYLDKSWNMIGSTGWDTIDNAVNGSDLFTPAFERYSNQSKE